jgi:hypothetical protein
MRASSNSTPRRTANHPKFRKEQCSWWRRELWGGDRDRTRSPPPDMVVGPGHRPGADSGRESSRSPVHALHVVDGDAVDREDAIWKKAPGPLYRPPRGIPLGRVRRKDFAPAGIERVPRMTGVRNGYPVLANGRVLEVSNVIWCTGYPPNYDRINLSVQTHNGLPNHDRGIVESCPGLYFIGFLFLYSLSSALVGGMLGAHTRHSVGERAEQRLKPPHFIGGLVFSVCCSHGRAGLCGGAESSSAWL